MFDEMNVERVLTLRRVSVIPQLVRRFPLALLRALAFLAAGVGVLLAAS
jgi:hypothetical protein